MAEAKEVTVTITDRLFTLELALKDSELIEVILGALKKVVKKGVKGPLKKLKGGKVRLKVNRSTGPVRKA